MYVLDIDLSAPGTCFGIQADDITLNLNGHTITYGTQASLVPVFGIVGAACWDPDFSKAGFGKASPCGGTFNKLTVYGGSIAQGLQAPAFSHAIRVGQGRGDGLVVHHVRFRVHADSSIPIYTTFVTTNAAIYNNVFENNVVHIQDRHQEEGQSIKLERGAAGRGHVLIYGNRITGGAQGGISSDIAKTKIYNNEVSQRGTYTNDFGILTWANDGEASGNTVIPILGRGIGIMGAKGEKVHGNRIIVIEQRDNEEYGGCQSGGAFGIQFDENAHESVSYGNTVIAKADQCDAQALRVTDSRKNSRNVSHDNTYTAQRIGQSTAFATGFGTGGATGFESRHDTFTGDTSAVAFDWDGGQNLVFRDCTFVKGTNPASGFVTFSFRNGGTVPVKNIHFIDSVFQNGAAKDSTNMKVIGSNSDWPGPAEYFIDWTLGMTVRDQDGKAVTDATVEIKDSFQAAVFHGVSDKDGKAAAVLTEFRMYNSASRVRKEEHTPHIVRISKKGCRTNPIGTVISMTQVLNRTIQIDCRTP